MIIIDLALAGFVAFALGFGLIVRPVVGGKLPNPREVPGTPNAGPALKKAAHAAINRKR